VIIAGGGVIYSGASSELQKFSTTFGIPVGETIAGKGAVQKDSATRIGAQGVQGDAACANIIRQADLVICVGTRLTDFTTGSRALFQNPKVQFVHINVNTADAYKLGALPMLADAREGLRALNRAARKAGIKPRPTYLKRVEKERSDWNQRMAREAFCERPDEPMNEGLLVRTVFEESKPGDTAVGASSGLLSNVFKIWDATQGRRCLLEFGYSCMGYEIPGALGTRLAQAKGEIFAFVGDGTYLMNLTELVTCIQENLKITVIVAENFGFQCIRAHQMHRAGRAFGNEFRHRDKKSNRLEGDYVKVDYVKTSEGFGARAWKANTVSELRNALRSARKEKGACVIVVETSSERYPPGSDMWWDVGVAEVSDDPVTRKLRRQYAKEVSEHQRFYY
jgi:3D-(3,5/4)-trihydroxycyclohexane-1,2-dione acylhydrolase (decyclizing)